MQKIFKVSQTLNILKNFQLQDFKAQIPYVQQKLNIWNLMSLKPIVKIERILKLMLKIYLYWNKTY